MAVHTIGGYRIIRKLGEGMHAQVLLAHPGGAAEPPVVVKLYRAQSPESESAALTEAEALSRAAGPHVVGLLDASRHDGATVLVLERLPGLSLERLLRQRGRLTEGEGITILAPLGVTLVRLHEAGVVHGRIAPDAVRFDESGAPVLTGFGGAQLREPGLSQAAKENDIGFVGDVAAFGELATTVLGHTAAGLLERPGTLEQLAERIYALGEPSAVSFAASESTITVPPRIEPPASAEMPATAEPEAAPPRISVAFVLPEFIERMLPSDYPEHLSRLRKALAGVRRRTWVAAGAVGLALVSALVLLSPGPPRDEPQKADPAAPAEEVVAVGEVLPEDPVAAAVELLQARERCIRELSVLCLDGVGQEGSAALAADQELIRAAQQGAEVPPLPTVNRSAAILIERLGDSAIVSLGVHGELLLMKGEAGWRIRQYLPAASA